MQATPDEFDEAPPMANGEVVLAIARGENVIDNLPSTNSYLITDF
jgi:hypothetical protein